MLGAAALSPVFREVAVEVDDLSFERDLFLVAGPGGRDDERREQDGGKRKTSQTHMIPSKAGSIDPEPS